MSQWGSEFGPYRVPANAVGEMSRNFTRSGFDLQARVNCSNVVGQRCGGGGVSGQAGPCERSIRRRSGSCRTAPSNGVNCFQ